MNWLDHVEAAGVLETSHSDLRLNKPIRAGNHCVSIQASPYHYCGPKELLPMAAYNTYEVAAWLDTGGRRGGWARWPWKRSEDAVEGWVPADEVQLIVDYFVGIARIECES